MTFQLCRPKAVTLIVGLSLLLAVPNHLATAAPAGQGEVAAPVGPPVSNAILCGNGSRDRGECCDDGNRLGGDRCSRDCSCPAREKVLILFVATARHIDLVATLRERVERAGGRVRAVLGLVGIIADIEPASGADLARVKGVQDVYRSEIAPAPVGDAQTLAAVAAWNRMLAPPAAPPRGNGPPAGAPPTDVRHPPDVPDDLALRQTADSWSRQRRQALRQSLPPQLQLTSGLGCGFNGAGYFDTSLYLAGNVAVGVFYVPGSQGGWTSALAAQSFADIVYSLDQFLDIQPNARLAFTYVNEVDVSGSPLPPPPTLADERDYVNDLRSAWCTDWAYLISVANGGIVPNADLHGPSARLDRTWGFFDQVVRHETGHIFGADDQYLGSGSYPTNSYGYLMTVHGNGCDNNSVGYFWGAGECLPDLMSGWDVIYGYNSMISPFTAGQLGWYDSDGNGVLDVAATKPVVEGTSVAHVVNPAFTVSYNGKATDRPLLGEHPSFGDVSINLVTAVQYRIGSASWQDATPTDGLFDSVSEDFQFTTPALRNGTYIVQIQAINTVGSASPIYQELLSIAGSAITNTRPFGSLSVTPKRAKFGTTVTASGLASRDLETSVGQLQRSWNWGDGSGWTPFQTTLVSVKHVYATPGTYTVQMRVRDAGGLVHLVSRSVTAESYDTAPVVAFSVTPENRHSTSGPVYSVALSAAGSQDGETPSSQLQVQWDADDDGNWDDPWANGKTKTVTLFSEHCYPYSDWRRVRVRIRDSAISPNISEAERFIWVVPYNHRPSLIASSVTFTPSGANYIASVNATHTDTAAWDGLLEYRYDFEGDGIWDTRFEPTPTTSVTDAGRLSLAVEVKDQFYGRSVWTPAGCNPLCQ